MKTKALTLLILLTLLTAQSCDRGLTGHEIVGRWEHAGEIYEFRDDGTFVHGNESYPYSVSGRTVTLDRNGSAAVFEYSLNPNGTLRLGELIYYPVGQKLKSSDESESSARSFAQKSIASE